MNIWGKNNIMKQFYHFALITENYFPFVGGGIAEWTHGIADNLSKLGHRVTVFSKWKREVDIHIHKDKFYEVQPMYGHDWRIFRYWYSFYYITKYLTRNPEGIVIATTWDLGEPFNVLKKFFKNSKLIISAHGKEITRIKERREINRFRKTIENASLVLAVSQFTRQEIFKRLKNNHEDHVIFVPNGVDVNSFYYTEKFDKISQQINVSKKNKIILTLARIVERKGHDVVIQCLPRILEKFPEVVYIIVGPCQDVSYYNYLKELIKQLHLEKKVIFTDMVERDDLNKYYSMSDVYVMVSRTLEEKGDSEGFGITFLEANACGCPVIGSYAGGIPDAVEDGVNGFLVPPDDVSRLTEKILTIIGNPSIAKQLKEDGLRRVENNFTWEKITEKIFAEFINRV
jgi:phosphatidylinositol alpha-1,6-mannosyltransferase